MAMCSGQLVNRTLLSGFHEQLSSQYIRSLISWVVNVFDIVQTKHYEKVRNHRSKTDLQDNHIVKGGLGRVNTWSLASGWTKTVGDD